jgi:co-chaperonin GroES (HSP10)
VKVPGHQDVNLGPAELSKPVKRKYRPAGGLSPAGIRLLEEGFRPLRDRILVRRDPGMEERIGSIIVPDCAQKPQFTGTVMAIGPKVCCLRPGDRVLFGQYTDFDQGNLVMIQEADVRVVFDERI